MKCIYCNKEIRITEDREIRGLDGDFIHKYCKSAYEKYLEEINFFNDAEFYAWLGVTDVE